jgi:hypothetical protein
MPEATHIPWKRVVAEVVSIVGSILLAFAINAWWANRTETVRTGELLSQLDVEWKSEQSRLDSTLDRFQRYREAMIEVMDLRDDSLLRMSEEKALDLFEEQRWSTFKPSTAALDTLLNEGLDHVHNDALRQAIASWHSVLNEPTPEQNALLELALGRAREVRADVAHRLGLPIFDVADEKSPLSKYGAASGKLALAILTDDEYIRVQRHILDIATDYQIQLRSVRKELARNIELLEAQLGD